MRSSLMKQFHNKAFLAALLIAVGLVLIPAFAWAQETEQDPAETAGMEAQLLADLTEEQEPEAAGRFATKRLIVLSDEVGENFGAARQWKTAGRETVLEYASEEETRAAYVQLKKNFRCYPDELLIASAEGDPIDLSLGMEALKAGTAIADVTVAVLDTGVDTENSRINAASFDFINGKETLTDAEGHGTVVAGIVARNTPDNVNILSCRVIGQGNGESSASMSTLLLIGSAIRYAQANGADIINMSFSLDPVSGSSGSLDYLNDIIEDAYQNGVICTVASGNEGRQLTADDYPACLGPVVTVGSVNGSGQRSKFSNYGGAVDFAAPGELKEMKGTSAAAPCIAACLAWLKGASPELGSTELIEKLRQTCEDLGDPGRDDEYGWGLPDMSKAGIATEHHYAKEVVRAETCTQSGIARYTCTDPGCTASFDKEIPKAGHTWKAELVSGELRFVCQSRGCREILTGDDLSGKLGSNLQWRIIPGGTNISGSPVARLEISGSGAMQKQASYPWEPFRDHITSLVLTDGITAISDNAFRGMKSLVQISHTEDLEGGARYGGFSSAMRTVGAGAFFDCDALKSITIGKNVSAIGAGAFSGCNSLRNISVEQGNGYFKAEGGCLYSGSRLVLAANGTRTISKTVTSIEAYAFCGSMTTAVDIPAGVTQIGAGAFSGCHALRSIVFNGTESRTIADDAFRDVNADIYYPEGTAGTWTGKSYGGILRWQEANLNEENAEVTLSQEEYSYTGEPARPAITVTYGEEETPLQEGTDYVLVYSGNVNPGTAEIRVVGRGNGYAGVITRTFAITKAAFDFGNLEVPGTVQAGEEIPVKYSGRLLKDLQELEIHYESNPSGMFCTEEDAEGNKILVARKHGQGTLTVTADSNEYYQADLGKRYQITVLPCGEAEHEWDEGAVLTKATYAKTGLKRCSCIKCGETKEVTIPKLTGAAPGSLVKAGGLTYKVKDGSTVEITKAPNRATINVPATITINKKVYRVTGIGSKAFYKKSRLKKLVVGSNVVSIGSKACYGCKQLKSVKIKGKNLKKIGSGAFRSIHKKAVVRVPAAEKKAYRSMLRKAGLKGKKQKVR